MWTCPLCNQQFVHTNQLHSCGDKVLSDFLKGKSEHTLSLFWHFTECYKQIGNVTIHPTKSMIAFAATTRMAYVIRLGKDFVDIVFPFKKPYNDNVCFHKKNPLKNCDFSRSKLNHIICHMKAWSKAILRLIK